MKKILFKTLTIITLTFFIIGCNKDDTVIISNATINTTEATAEITFTSMKISGKVVSNDGNEITSQGVCWGKDPNPTINGNKITETTATFSRVITDLIPNTTYYFRVFATTNAGTTYSKDLSLNTLSLGNTKWEFTINYSSKSVKAVVDFNEDFTTKYVEPDCTEVDCYTPFGTWSLEGNKIKYIGEGSDPSISTHVFEGTISELSMQGTYVHQIDPDGTWSAVKL